MRLRLRVLLLASVPLALLLAALAGHHSAGH